MSDDKVYTPEVIAENPIPEAESVVSLAESASSTGETHTPTTVKDQPVVKKRVAQELIGTALNTKSRKILAEFQFTESGAIAVGKYEPGVSGDVRITPNGITARDIAGLITFLLDASTGDAIFKGTIQSGALIAGQVIVGDNRVIIDGENKQIIINDGITDRILIGYQENGF